ncbi:hypothetical protein DBR40_00395 [Pedobacter sp. KBW01]|nr:hypothetical protein DBR40_00395 [Pedobacter sp. KBW01]
MVLVYDNALVFCFLRSDKIQHSFLISYLFKYIAFLLRYEILFHFRTK